jgi:hypothetical protein
VTLGLHTVNLANKWLDTLRAAGAAFGPITPYVKLHIGDPGSAGTANPSVLAPTTRNAATFSAAASGSIALASNPTAWTAGAGSQETISHISVWDASSAGNYLWSAAITTPQAWNTGNTFTLTSLGISLTPLAA